MGNDKFMDNEESIKHQVVIKAPRPDLGPRLRAALLTQGKRLDLRAPVKR
jgi:hypothetical protein